MSTNDTPTPKKAIPLAVKAIAGVAAVGCLTAVFTTQMLHKSNKPSDEPSTASSTVVYEATSETSSEAASGASELESEVTSEITSEITSEEAASSEEFLSASSPSNTSKSSTNKTTSGKAKTQQQVVVEPRMKQKTETWADRPIPPDEHGYYGVLYAPDINTEESIFFGDEQKFLDAGWGQQTDTFIVGYECAHLFWSDNEKCVR